MRIVNFHLVVSACFIGAMLSRSGAARHGHGTVVPPPASMPETTRPGPAAPATQPDPNRGRRQGDPFYFIACATCDKPRWHTGSSITWMLDNRELRFCSQACLEQFTSDVDASIIALDKRMIADQRPHYPLRTSIVTGKALGAETFDVVWNNRLFRLANREERDLLLNDPARWLSRLDETVIEAQSPIYGPTKCPVQGDFLDPEEIRDIVIANRMIKLCCGECVKVVRDNPGQYLVMVDYSNREAAERRAAAASQPER